MATAGKGLKALVNLSPSLKAVIGKSPITRTETTKKL